MREIDARVTGFDYTTFHAYTTEVEVDGRSWSLGLRYNTFYQFYTRLAALEKHFTVDFPPKGGLFFSPPPEERQEQLDDFLLSTLAYFDMRGHPRRMEALLSELLQIPEHLGIKDDDERTASEGSSAAEELLLDTPMPGHDDNDFLDSETEDDDHDVHEDQSVEEDNQVEVEDDNQTDQEGHVEVVEVLETEPKEKQDGVEVKGEEDNQQVAEVMLSPMSETKVQPLHTGKELTGGSVAKKYIAMLRRRTLEDGAIQAAVVSAMKQNVEKSKAVKAEKAAEEQQPVEGVKGIKMEELDAAKEEIVPPEMEEKPEAPVVEKASAGAQDETTSAELTTELIPETAVSVVEVSEDVTAVPEEEAVKAIEAVAVSAPAESPIESDLDVVPVTETKQQDSVAQDSAPTSVLETEAEAETTEASSSEEESEKEAAPQPSEEESESENPVVSWFRRMGSTFGPSAAEKEEQEAAAAAKKEQEEREAAARAEVEAETEAKAKAATEAAKAEAQSAAKIEAKEGELLRAEQELNLRLKPYRHPVFFQGFNCDVGTSRYSLPTCPSDGIVV
ncbi:uncharacterized protein KRP23_7222 [Phytophthora ramorum]|uniref:uncharacterized protein n=1 Tax=Phytophthora ramorum TaxID=164328 RepID=UPI0030AED2FB|nr:hypothetical protein KRP23_7222 [Phytophthora ramorum]